MEEIEKYLRKIKKPISMEKILEKCSTLGEYDIDKIKELIQNKVDNYELIVTENGNYIPIRKTSFRVGVYHSFKNGNGIIDCDENKYSITAEYSKNIIDGDIVLIDTYIPSGSKVRSCRVQKLISRDISKILGEITKLEGNYYVVPEDPKKQNLTIYLEGKNYIEGEKVIVECIEKRNDNFYVGSIIKEVGHKDDPGVDILLEAYKHNIDNEITEEELKELESIPTCVLDSDKIGRMDFTTKEIFTIDGEDSKDLDDAVSLEIKEDGTYVLGVYIADVTHYVKEDSLLDLRARKKGTSSYLANTVIPMLPHKLSNGICSLNPNVERLALGCTMEFNKQGERTNYYFHKSVIKSNLKMSYEKVNAALEQGIVAEEYQPHLDTLKQMSILAQKLKNNRIKNGAIELNKPELKLIMDDQSQVIDFSKRYQRTAESIIEEFMIITNETIAEDMFVNGYPFVYRNHEAPSEEKMIEYLDMLKILGYKYDFKSDDLKLGQQLATYLEKDDPLTNTLKTKLIKSFKRAFYSQNDLGHYGLASKYYCHFTSPIRRYPDTTNHRLINDFYFTDENKEKMKNKWRQKLNEIAKNCSIREREADECERMVLLMKCAEYMEKHINEEFEGTITEIYNEGMQIELNNMIEGRVRQKDLKGKYVYYPLTQTYLSLDHQEDYYLGDVLKLRVSYANKEKKEIDFEVIGKVKENERINKKTNEKVRVMEKKKRSDLLYYNVNKGRKER